MTVTVPWATPVGTAARPAAFAAAITSSGRAGVAMSMSVTVRPSKVLRTAPPTARAAKPWAASAANTALVSGRLSQLASSRRGGAGAAMIASLLQRAGLDAPVFHVRWRVDRAWLPAGRRRSIIDQRGADQQCTGNEEPDQRRFVDDGAGG